LVRPSEEDLSRAVSPLFTTEGAFHHDRLERELDHARRYVAVASLAGDDKGLAECRSLEHGNSIGEEKAKRNGWDGGEM
jgi:hypothetical protein